MTSRGTVVIGALVLLAQLGGGTPGAGPAEQIERSVTQPLAQAPSVSAAPSPDAWVPDRFIPNAGGSGTSLVPGHWERSLPNGRSYVPPLTTCSPGGGCSTSPAGEYPPPATRVGPP